MKPPRARHPRVNWDEARAFYLALDPDERSYARVSAEYGVSQGTVSKWARRQDWPGKAAALDRSVADHATSYVVKTRTERVALVLQLVDRYTSKVNEKLIAGSLDVKASDVAQLVKVAELLTGEPTDRIQIAQLQPILDSYDEALDKLRDMSTDPEQADLIIRRLDDDLLAFAATARAREHA